MPLNSKFVQITKNTINIRVGIEPTKAEDDEEPIHGFIEDRLHPVFGVDLSSGEQFQNHHWTRIQDYLKQSYISNNHCDVSIMVSDGTILVNRLMIILLFPVVLHWDEELEYVIVPDYTLDQIKDNINSLLNSSNIKDINNNNKSVDEVDTEYLVSSLTILTAKLEDDNLSEDDIVNILVELHQLEVTIPTLLETGAGKVVRRLKHKGGRVAELAKKLVTRWKKVVIEYEPPLLDVGEAVDSELNNIGSDGHGGRDGSNEPLMITTASSSVSSPTIIKLNLQAFPGFIS